MSYKLSYFNARGLVEPLRMIMAIGDIEYEDFRFPLEFPIVFPPEVKQNATWGQVPVMEIDGKILTQTCAMFRFFAKKSDLMGADDFENAKVDEYGDTYREFLQTIVPAIAFPDPDPVKHEEKLGECLKKMDEKYLRKFNEIIEANGGKWLIGNKMTWADICLAHVFDDVEIITDGQIKLTKNYPTLQSYYERVFSHPKIKTHVESRPVTKF